MEVYAGNKRNKKVARMNIEKPDRIAVIQSGFIFDFNFTSS